MRAEGVSLVLRARSDMARRRRLHASSETCWRPRGEPTNTSTVQLDRGASCPCLSRIPTALGPALDGRPTSKLPRAAQRELWPAHPKVGQRESRLGKPHAALVNGCILVLHPCTLCLSAGEHHARTQATQAALAKFVTKSDLIVHRRSLTRLKLGLKGERAAVVPRAATKLESKALSWYQCCRLHVDGASDMERRERLQGRRRTAAHVGLRRGLQPCRQRRRQKHVCAVLMVLPHESSGYLVEETA
mmetsp:Transcript_4356/g.11404  ORF Transcript_4356/g.11404 Transcript_4356/m.11404 type:complete len:246 (+) Transcript_4356:360-1097(+)